MFNIKELLCKCHLHDMERTAHWCDPDCSVIIVEYKCTRCKEEAWEFLHFEPTECKVLKRISVDATPIEAAQTAECTKVDCEIAKQPVKRTRRSSKTTADSGAVEASSKAA